MRRILFLGAAAACAWGAWACTASSESAEPASDESELNGKTEVKLGTCAIKTIPGDRSTMIAPQSVFDFVQFPRQAPELDQIVTKATLKVRLDTSGGKRRISSISATLSRGADKGKLTFDTRQTAPSSSTMNVLGQGYETRWFVTEDGKSSITLGEETTKIDALVLQWGTAGQWMMVGNAPAKADAAATDAAADATATLVAVAPNCKFDVKAWNLLRDIECEEELYGDAGNAGADAGESACRKNPSDEFPTIDGGSPADAGVGTMDAGGATVDAGAGKEPQPDASTHTEPNTTTDEESSSDLEDSSDSDEYTPSGQRSSKSRTPGMPTAPSDTSKTSASASCSAVPATASFSSASLAFVAIALLGAARRRRKD